MERFKIQSYIELKQTKNSHYFVNRLGSIAELDVPNTNSHIIFQWWVNLP